MLFCRHIKQDQTIPQHDPLNQQSQPQYLQQVSETLILIKAALSDDISDHKKLGDLNFSINCVKFTNICRDSRGRDRMLVGFTTTCSISADHH